MDTTLDTESKLKTASLLNSIGASAFALKILETLDPQTAEQSMIAGRICLSNFEFKRAISHLEKMSDRDRNPMSYVSRLSRIHLADAYSGTGSYEQAYLIAAAVLKVSKEPGLERICLQAMGAFLARLEKLEESMEHLFRARARFPGTESGAASGMLCKWLGYVSARMGDPIAAQDQFSKAETQLRSPKLRIEGFLHLLLLKRQVGLLDAADWARACHYPGLSKGFLNHLRTGGGEVQLPLELGSIQPKLKIDLSRKTDLSLEHRFLADLAIAGDWGISLSRAKTLLWPDEIYGFTKLDARVSSLLAKLKKNEGFTIQIREEVLRLTPAGRKRLQVILRAPRPLVSATSRLH